MINKLVVVFPGIGYHKDKPLLYYGAKLAKETGYENCINISYSCDKEGLIGNKEKIQKAFETLYEQAKIQLANINFAKYEDVLFISKSIGTAIALAFASENSINAKHVLYTPIEHGLKYECHNAIAFTGTADPWVNHENIVNVCADKHIPLTIVNKANHSLEVNDSIMNIGILKKVMEKTKEFLLIDNRVTEVK